MPTMSATDLLSQLSWRYAVKQFDPTRTLTPETWSTLAQALVLSPSSFGLQPYRFLAIASAELKARLRPASWNQSQITDCSHLVVFTVRTGMIEADVDHFVARTAAVRGVSVESIAGYRKVMVGDVVHGVRGRIAQEWATRQAYIALGNLMTSAAVLGVDACPLEGLEPAKYDEILGLAPTGYATVVACALGYRAATDKYATLPKVRFPLAELVEVR